MAITSAQRTEIVKATVAMFGAAPGGYMTELTSLFEANGSNITNFMKALALTPAFTGQAAYSNYKTVEEKATSMASAYGLTDITTAGSAGKQAYDYFVAQLTAGVNIGEIFAAANSFLASTTDTAFTSTKTLMTNKTAVAEYYTVTQGGSSTTLSTLQSTISSVTATTDVSTDAAKATVISGTAAATTGSTYTLVKDVIDSVVGTAGDDTIIGDVNTSAADSVNGGAGTDTVKLYGTATILPQMSNVEKLYLNGVTDSVDASAVSGLTNFDIVNPTTLKTYTAANGVDMSIATVANGETVDIAGNTVTSLDLTLNDFAGTATGADATLDLNSTAQTTLNITTATAASQVTLTNTGAALTTITVAGDKNLELGHALTTITTINASTMTGALDVDTIGASNLTFTGGAGNDRINMVATLTANDTIKGGAGTDSFAVAEADTVDTSSEVAGVSEFEVFELVATQNSNEAVDMTSLNVNNNFTGIKISSGNETGGANTFSVTNIEVSAKDNIIIAVDADSADDAGTTAEHVTLSVLDMVSGGTSDSATLKFDNSLVQEDTGVDVGTLTMTLVDVVNIQSISDGTRAAGEENSIASLVLADAEKIVVTGDQDFEITDLTAAGLAEVDASGLTGTAAFTFDTGTSGSNSLLIKGTANADTITADVATAAVTLYTGGGSDTITVEATTADTLMFTATTLNSGDVKAGNVVTINGSVAAANDLVINFSSGLEALLKNASGTLASATANQTFNAAISSTTTNVGYTESGEDIYIDIDLNGDGTYVEANDFRIKIVGANGANGADMVSSLTYVAASDHFVFA